MSKFLKKLVKKWSFLSGILAGLLIAATVIGIFFGFNGLVTDGKQVTVTVDPVLYKDQAVREEIKDLCDDAFDGALYSWTGDNGGNDGVFVYAFKENANLDKAVADLTADLAQWTDDYSVTVVVTTEKVVVNLAEGFVVRAAIAGVVLAVLAFAYAAIRYNWRRGIVAGVSVAAAMLLTGAIVILARIPATTSVVYAIMGSGLAAAITVLFTLNKLRAEAKENANKDAEELVVSSIAVKEIAIFSAILGVAILLVAIPAGVSGAWFALSAFIGIAIAAFMGMIYAPALCLPMQKAMAAQAASTSKSGYKGAKKGAKATVKPAAQPEEKKEEPKTEEAAPVAEPEEAPVEEAEVIEESVEDVPAEETELSEEDVEKIDEAFADEE